MKCLEDVSKTQINAVIDEYIHHERNRNLLKRRLLDSITYERLAEEFDLSVGQTKKICADNVDVIRKNITKIIL